VYRAQFNRPPLETLPYYIQYADDDATEDEDEGDEWEDDPDAWDDGPRTY